MRRPNVIAVMSPKGGVGKTVTTVNLATVLATKFNKKILAIDTNISIASLGLHFDLIYPKTTIHNILEKNFPIEKAIYIYHDNLHIIPSSIKIRKEEKNLDAMRKNMIKIVSYYDSLLEKLSKNYDLILLDCAPGFDMETIAVMHVAGGLIIVTNPEYPAIVTATKVAEYAKRMRIPTGGIVLNKVRNKKYEPTKEEIENAVKIKVLEKIPFDKKIPESIANRIPIVLFKPHSKSSRAYKRLATSIIGEKHKKNLIEKIFRRK